MFVRSEERLDLQIHTKSQTPKGIVSLSCMILVEKVELAIYNFLGCSHDEGAPSLPKQL